MTRVNIENLVFTLPEVETTRRAPAEEAPERRFEDHLRQAGEAKQPAPPPEAPPAPTNKAPEKPPTKKGESAPANAEAVEKKESGEEESEKPDKAEHETDAAVVVAAAAVPTEVVDETKLVAEVAVEAPIEVVEAVKQEAKKPEAPAAQPTKTTAEQTLKIAASAAGSVEATDQVETETEEGKSKIAAAKARPVTTPVSEEAPVEPIAEEPKVALDPEIEPKDTHSDKPERGTRRDGKETRAKTTSVETVASAAPANLDSTSIVVSTPASAGIEAATTVTTTASDSAAPSPSPDAASVAANVPAQGTSTNENAAAQTGAALNSAGPALAKNGHAAAAAQGTRPSPIEYTRFVQRVSRAFHALGDEGGQIKLRLSPPELGSLKLEVKLQDGVMTARLEAETAAARGLLVDSLPQLRERLAEQGIQIERFDVDLMNQSPGDSGENFAGRESESRGDAPTPRRAASGVAESNRSAEPARGQRAARGELDLLI